MGTTTGRRGFRAVCSREGRPPQGPDEPPRPAGAALHDAARDPRDHRARTRRSRGSAGRGGLRGSGRREAQDFIDGPATPRDRAPYQRSKRCHTPDENPMGIARQGLLASLATAACITAARIAATRVTAARTRPHASRQHARGHTRRGGTRHGSQHHGGKHHGGKHHGGTRHGGTRHGGATHFMRSLVGRTLPLRYGPFARWPNCQRIGGGGWSCTNSDGSTSSCMPHHQSPNVFL